MKLALILSSMFLLMNAVKAQVVEPFENGMIITEWDLAFPDTKTLERYQGKSNLKSTSLIVNTLANKTFDVWSKTDRKKLIYCISNDFKTNKKDVVEALKVATEDWMDAGGVKFIYKPDQDANCTASNQNVMFDVRPASAGQYLARAFFPSYKRAQRNIMIDSSSFQYSFVAMTGFLRHELGHVLGFRHEHISKDAVNNCSEDSNFSAVTRYDQLSVMHYPQCGGKNNLQDMILSALDQEGMLKVYPF